MQSGDEDQDSWGFAAGNAGVKVDVGIPTFGHPSFLAQSVASVRAQTFRQWRLRISEDGPSGGDVQATIRHHIADPRVVCLSSGKHIGAAANMTRLIQGGQAPYVAILHDDDRWESGFLEARVQFLDAHPECALVFSGNLEIDEHDRTVGRSQFELPEGVYEPADFAPILLRHNVIAAPTVVVRRSAYEAVGSAFDDRFLVMYDYEMWLRIALRFPVGFIPRWDAHYRRHDGQTTYRVRHLGDEWLRLFDHFDELVTQPQSRVSSRPPSMSRRRSGAFLTAALDEIERNRPRQALANASAAIWVYPRSAFDPRLVAALGGLVLGSLGRAGLARSRRFVHRHSVRLHRQVR